MQSNDSKIIINRRKVWHAVIPLVIYIAVSVPMLVFDDFIRAYVFGFLPPRAANIIYIVLMAAKGGIVFVIYVIWYFADIMHVLMMPKDMVIISYDLIVVTKCIKIEHHKTQKRIANILDDGARVMWIGPKQVNRDHLWEEEWHGEVSLRHEDIAAIGLLADSRRYGNRLTNGKRVSGALIIVTTSGEILVAPKLDDLNKAHGALTDRIKRAHT